MKHIIFGSDLDNTSTAILIKNSSFNKFKLKYHYINYLNKNNLTDIVGFNLKYETPSKCSAKYAKKYIAELLPVLANLSIKTLLVCDSTYFKYFAKISKIGPFYGHSVPCAIEGYKHINLVLCPNFISLNYNPDNKKKITQALDTLIAINNGSYIEPGKDIIHSAEYISKPEKAAKALNSLLNKPALTVDIETVGLEFWNCGIATISFAWDEHNGIAIAVNRGEDPHQTKMLLKYFFINYEGQCIYHNAMFDVKVLIYELWMMNLGDYVGLIEGLHTMYKNTDCSQIITYLATNNTVKNVLKLKELSAEFAGDYGQDNIEDTRLIKISDLLEYNLKDCLATWYVYNKYKPIMIEDQQEYLYTEVFRPAMKSLTQMELCGIPIDPAKVKEARTKLEDIIKGCERIIYSSSIIKDFQKLRLTELAKAKTAKAKKKVYTVDDPVIAKQTFNYNSGDQLQDLLYDYLGYPVYDLTKKKKPATGAKTLKKILANAKCEEHKKLVQAFLDVAQASKILTTFIPAFENAQELPDGSYRMYGNFKLGGTISLRLSSSHPNLQNLPSGSNFGKLIKACIVSTNTWVFTGIDYDSLEDRVNTLQTKDPNKLKIYIDGFDGHCFRAYNYWPEQMPDINPNSVNSINSIKKKYKQYRQASKAPSFALQYSGTFMTLMNNCGFDERTAKQIETNYHKMYKVADKWAENHINKAKETGYVPLAFGGRLRTPLLKKYKNKPTYASEKEGRSAGNALTQSYCIMTLNSLNLLMERIWKSEYCYNITPAIAIHDANYFVAKNDLQIIKWLNDNLVDCMQTNELPELQHDKIKITAAMEVFYKNWCHSIELPKYVSKEEIKAVCIKGRNKIEEIQNNI